MKKYSIYALMGAIALAGSVGFSSCSSSSDDVVINNPDFDPVTNTVKTTISLSINPNNGSSTRQSGTNVQSAGNFRGISDILSLPSTGDITTGTSTTGKLNWDAISGFDGSSANYKLYNNQQIVVGVDHFLFIGRATASQSGVNDKLAYGFTNNNLDEAATTTVGAIQVTPEAMVSSTDISTSSEGNWKYQSDALASYLTAIANATDATDATNKWSTTINPSLRSMYDEFTRTGTATTLYNAGSAESVRLLLLDLLDKIDGINDETVAGIKTAIRTAIGGQATIGGSSGANTVTWKEDCVFKSFPTSLGLPEGSAEYMWDATTDPTTPSFKYITDNTVGNNFTAVENYVFPNELYYLTKTPLRATSNATVTWPGTADNWATTAPWTADTWTDAVAANSKNIALTYNINYGSALLATYVKAGAATLYDNARQLDPDKRGDANAVNNAIVVKDGETDKNPFELTGVLVGAQPSAVGWNFLPVEGATYNKVVYDGVMNGTINITTANNATPNYTLLFDNYRSVTGDDLNVNVCLEFKNNMTSSFYGKDGVILPGQKFYIVGKLTVNGATNPFTSLGTDDVIKAYVPSRDLRAFIQDYLTTANFTLTAGTASGNGDGSLAKAMTTIPDLRQSSQTIGLSVDLTWNSGVTYNVNLGE